MDSTLVLLVFTSWVCWVAASYHYYSYRKKQQEVLDHLESYHLPNTVFTKKKSWMDSLNQWFDRFSAMGEKIQFLSDPLVLEDALIKAGYPFDLTVERLQGAKIVGLLAGLLIALPYYLLGLPLAVVLIAALPLVGYLIPVLGIKQLAKSRQEQIRMDLPDFLDMMSITLQAGMSLDSALAYYVETTKGPLSEEFARLNHEIKFGVQREVAYRSLLRRTASPELEGLIQSLIQAHNLGTPIASTFMEQADEMRRMRAERAKEAAGKAGPKITIVGGALIAPSVMILILGVIILQYVISPNSPLKM
ncbi:hypothetical protein JIR001_01110 [Polycladomyces abyssicola]|uniref:Type II secretion system protein GspF domain-containing protein n=1 Tax=Polycladomyces abyssicola TaxID=1125966 RepID=A0A8D5ZMI4_9BACL|nr:type II secretion system F family protein [Polycladomyces abyssicola]BCU80328.1 hypothetical protein JIR001_01110 [Polycladomyces abyssicola]